MKSNVKAKKGRPTSNTVMMTAMIPPEMDAFIRGLGLNSPTIGMKLIWEKIKDNKALLKKLKGE